MENQKKQLEPLINWTALKAYKDEATYNKIRRHLVDINDTISEDDIRNIKIHEIYETVSAVSYKTQFAVTSK